MATPSLKAFKPLGDRVLVIVHKPEHESSIIRPIGCEDPIKHARATIVSTGKKVDPKEVKNRDVVIIPKEVGHDIIVNGSTYRLLRVIDIIAKI